MHMDSKHVFKEALVSRCQVWNNYKNVEESWNILFLLSINGK
jgi:hypothetical protein